MKKLGEYYYTPKGRHFAIYVVDSVSNGVTTGRPAEGEKLYYDREEARKRVYELNGWNYVGRKS